MDEFARIQHFLRPLSQDYKGSFALGDDVAMLAQLAPKQAHIINMDSLAEGVHFLPHSDPYLLAQKLLAVNLSDLAAKGAWPECYFLSLALPPSCDDEWFSGFAKGLAAMQKRYGFSLAGGDSISVARDIVLGITMVGRAPIDKNNQAVWHRRNRLKPGDHLYVTGTIGDGYLGLRLAQDPLFGQGLDHQAREDLIMRYLLPSPRLSIGKALLDFALKHKIQPAAIDISDGLIADCSHLLNASSPIGLTADIKAEYIPISDAASALIAEDLTLFPALLGGGDDYEILFSLPPSHANKKMWPPELQAASFIGKVTASSPTHQNKVKMMARDGHEMDIPYKGYKHRP